VKGKPDSQVLHDDQRTTYWLLHGLRPQGS
jgi:hypothetical protein